MAEAFAPTDAADQVITLSGSSQRVPVRQGTAGSQVAVLVTSLATATAFIRAGDVTVTSTTARLPIPAGSVQALRFTIPASGVLYIAAISTGTPGDIWFTPGEGV